MLNRLQAFLVPALSERLTLVFNHVLASEPAATARLLPHAGRTLALNITNWPALLPAPPALAWRITPAGLLEWCGVEALPAHDLSATLDAPNPAALLARLLAGETPPLQIEGDAQLAGELNWLLQNLRWDVAADLERLFGPVVAQSLHRVGTALAAALRKGLGLASRGAAGLGERLRPRGS
jgi:ubiquinone biosynthesis protein UbiJ